MRLYHVASLSLLLPLLAPPPKQSYRFKVGSRYSSVIVSTVEGQQRSAVNDVAKALDSCADAAKKMLEVYAKTFRVNFSITNEAEDAESSGKIF